MSVRTMYGARLGLGEETGSPPGLRITYTVKTDDAGAISGVALLSRETRIDQFGAPSLRSKRGVGMWRTLKDLHVTPGSNTTLSTAAYEADDGPSTLPFVSPGYELHDAPPWEAITVADAHAVYLRWKPWGPGSIWVTLASLLFRFKGAARRGDSGAVWAPKVENPEIVGPSIFRTGKLPEWEYSVPSTQDADLRANWEVSQ